MEIKEFREKTDTELEKSLALNKEKLRDLNFKVANKQVKNLSVRKEIRRDIAKILTILNQREHEKDAKK